MLMDVQEIVSPANLGVVLDQFKTFALARGWVLDGDSGGVFQLRSTGFGNQNMIFRFQGLYTDTYAYYGRLTIAGVSPLTPAFSTSMTTGVYTATGAYAQMSIRGAGAFKAWIMGNNRFLAIVQQNNEYSCTIVTCGSFDLFDTSRNDGFFATFNYGSGGYLWDTTLSNQYNYSVTPGSNFAYSQNSVWLYGAGRNNGYYRPNLFIGYASSGADGDFDSLKDFYKNGTLMPYSGGRLVVQSTVYGLDPNASLWRPIGRLPWCLMYFTGLTPGQTIDFGGDTYKVFPSMYMPHPFGWAVKVA